MSAAFERARRGVLQSRGFVITAYTGPVRDIVSLVDQGLRVLEFSETRTPETKRVKCPRCNGRGKRLVRQVGPTGPSLGDPRAWERCDAGCRDRGDGTFVIRLPKEPTGR